MPNFNSMFLLNGKKINSIEELLQVYNPNKDINGTYQYDFYMPSMPDGLKRHDNIPILKCNQIKDSKGNIIGKIEMVNLIEGMKRPKSQGTNITG